jgi:serine/threonine protein kinase
MLKNQPGVPEIEGIELQSEIGEGGFGIVYRAHQVGMVRRKVALKVLKPGVDTRQVLRRFEIERQALAHLEHPGIARFYEAGQTKEGYPYFTMELVEGLPINEAVGGQPLTEVIGLFLQVCESVAHAHDQGILHRDLKPGNILVTSDGAPKVIDFGLAKALDAEQAPGMTLYTGGESWLGTPGYAAPEQLNASEIELDERADVFSLGAILYHLLTGLNPGDAREMATRPNEFPPPSEIALQKIEPALDAIVMHALSLDRDKRYSSVRALMADLRRQLNGDALSVKPTKRRSLNRPLLAAAIILPLAAAWMIYSNSNRKAEQKPNTSIVESSYRGFTFEEIGFHSLDENEEATSPFEESRNFTWVRFRKPDGGEFILSYDGLFGSPTVTQFFTGAQRPDDPAAKVIPIDSDEDKKLVALYEGLIENAIGLERAAELDATPWSELPKGEGSAQLRMLKNLYGAVMFFKDQRHKDEW